MRHSTCVGHRTSSKIASVLTTKHFNITTAEVIQQQNSDVFENIQDYVLSKQTWLAFLISLII